MRAPPPGAPAQRRGGSDKSVQSTNDDAQISKLSCVRKGYFRDDFVKHFVHRPSRRSPLINRGYYSRVTALQQLIRQFLQAGRGTGETTAPLEGPKRQVLSLGAGYDTLFFMMQASGVAPDRYYELDFQAVTSRKSSIIQDTPALLSLLGEAPAIDTEVSRVERDASSCRCSNPGADSAALDGAAAEAGRITSERYCLLPADLRELGALQAVLQEAGFDPSLPTLVLSECVLVYMEPSYNQAVVDWAGQVLCTAVFVVYEMIKPDDAFGRQMLINLESRGCPPKGIHGTPSLEAQRQRFLSSGHWQRAEAHTMRDIHEQFLDKADLQRAERIEIFDEFEQWHMIQGLFEDFGFKTAPPLAPGTSAGSQLPCAD